MTDFIKCRCAKRCVCGIILLHKYTQLLCILNLLKIFCRKCIFFSLFHSRLKNFYQIRKAEFYQIALNINNMFILKKEDPFIKLKRDFDFSHHFFIPNFIPSFKFYSGASLINDRNIVGRKKKLSEK